MSRKASKHITLTVFLLLGLLLAPYGIATNCSLKVHTALAQVDPSFTFQLVKGINGISMPFEGTGISTAEELANDIPYCNMVWYWDAANQRFVGHARGSDVDDFPVIPGYPYFVNVTQDTSWTISGTTPEPVMFDLITTPTTNINCIALPSDINITNAEELANDITYCDTVWYWDATRQGYVGHPKGTEINNFAVSPGYPYFVNVTAETSWGGGLRVHISASTTKGGIPLEVQFSAVVSGGTSPYTYAWDLDGDGTVDDTRASFSYIYQQYGTYTVTLTVTDATGDTASDELTISALSAPTVLASASPTSGSAPLDVSFSCTTTDPDGTIVLYEWDFDGNGTYDWSDSDSCSTPYTYTANGLYHATIKVTDNDGLTGTDSVTITVGASPTASASADPMTGPVPLEVTFTGTGTDPDGTVDLYEWDFEGDGIYDWSSPTTGNTTHTYTSSGIFNATLRVTDNDGLIGTDSVLISASGLPIANPRAYPTSGDVPLEITFFCDGDDLDGSPVKFEWDFDGDGNYDWSKGYSVNTTHIYTEGGTYNATLRVTDNEGLTDTAFITITVTDPNPEGYPTAIADANPTNGGAPLTVALIGEGTDPNGTISKYEWDFEGDGIYDWEELAIDPESISLPVSGFKISGRPIFVDIDGDEDYDMFVGEYYGTIHHYRNDGNNNSPLWTSMGMLTDSDGNTIDVGYYSSPAFVDIDNDEDFDMFIGEDYGEIYFYRNDGDNTSPIWTSVGAITDSGGNTIDVGWDSSPTFVDIDNDEDYDMFVGEYDGTIHHYRNDGNNNSPLWTSMGMLTDSGGNTIDVGYYSSPTFVDIDVDIDNDGDFDMFIGERYGEIYFYRNDGDNTSPIWTSVGAITDSGGNTIDVGYYSSPTFVDIDNDEDYDMFVFDGGYYRVYHYRNDGTSSLPVWTLISKNYNYVGAENSISPALIDIDNDGDHDLFIGDNWGNIYFYRNDGDANSFSWVTIELLMDSTGNTVNVNQYASPTFADIDGDGDYDMFVGESDGRIYFYQNDGDATTPVWTPMGMLTDSGGNTIDVGWDSSPTFVDIDNDEDYDMFVGEYDGTIHHYRNDGNNNSPLWTSMGMLTDSGGDTIDVGWDSSPTFVDIDNDEDYDLFIGEYNGKIYFYRNDGDVYSPSWTLVSSNYRDINVDYSSSPALVDIGNDGDYDLFVGNDYGYVYFYPTVGYVTHVYENPGTYQATLRVTDSDGLTDTDSVTIDVYASGSPTAIAFASLTTGDVPLTVSFTGTGTDPDGTITLYEWDFDGDGTYDWSSTSTGNTSYTYTKVGTFNAKLRVTDSDGKTATDSVIIKTSLGISTSRTGVFNPNTGETGTISSTLTDDAVVTVKVIDEAGNVVRTLVDNVSRTAGSYSDVWDGKDDLGNLVRDGLYHFVMEYTVNGETYTYDLRADAEYEQNVPSHTFPSTFSPYKDIFYELAYTLNKPAEVSIYFWTWGPDGWSVEHVRTLFTRELRGDGSHTEIWDGTDDKGAPVSPEKEYMRTIWTWDIADNSIIIFGDRPEITNASAEPNYFSPAYNPYGSTPTQQTIISFNLSEASNVEVRIVNFEGVLVRTMSKTNLPAGANSIIWDGKDIAGKLVKGGSYRITLTAIDSSGNRSMSRSALVMVYY